jgi:ATP-dependent Clp protease ATP-binding subunit ClpC
MDATDQAPEPPAPPAPAPSGISPASLELALDWLQRSLDSAIAVPRRMAAGDPVTDPPGQPLAPASRSTAGSATSPGMAVPSPAPASGPGPGLPPAARATAAPATAAPATAAPAGATPLLDRIGRDLTRLAAEGSLAPLIGRKEEMDWLIEVLCRTGKRNPVLLGPAGAGKTAMVEGLAQRIAAGSVPAPLAGARVIEVPLGALVAGTEYRGQLEQRVQQLIDEASRPGIILFIDEIHLLEAAGSSQGGVGPGQILKPALARGDIAVIGATTPEEYRATIEQDAALARRFVPIEIRELTRDDTRPILRAVRDGLARKRGIHVTDEALEALLDFADRSIINRRFPDKAIDLLEQTVAAALVAGRTTVDRRDALKATQVWLQRASSTPALDRFGRDLVALARAGKLGPIVGRDAELDAIVEVLLRRTRRNPLLIGPAGAGKTAIVEGLAIRIAAGAVPEALRGIRLFDVPLLSLAGGIAEDPTLLPELLLEVRHPSVVVFFDEIHLLAAPAVRDLGQALKPALARGEIACIGATTGEEFQASLEPDAALVRRFSVIAIEPMDEAAIAGVMSAVRTSLAQARGVTVDDPALAEIVSLADQFLPNRSFPDKGVDLLEQAVAYALAHGLTVVDKDVARAAVSGLTGMPADRTASIRTLAGALDERRLLSPAASVALVQRLGVTLRGLDSGARRPDAVLLLCGPAAEASELIAEAVATTVFKRGTAIIAIDLAGLSQDQSISTLLGSAPGLVGSDRPLPLQELRRSPWQVVLFRGIDSCAPSIRSTIAAALVDGAFTDAMGRRLPLGSSIVILTAPSLASGDGPPAGTATAGLVLGLGQDLIAACDVVAGSGAGAAGPGDPTWLQRDLLAPLAARFARMGFQVSFEPDFVEWLRRHLPESGESPEAYMDRSVTPLLAAALPVAGGPTHLVARIADDRPTLEGRS